jgi:hypothetical protein
MQINDDFTLANSKECVITQSMKVFSATFVIYRFLILY